MTTEPVEMPEEETPLSIPADEVIVEDTDPHEGMDSIDSADLTETPTNPARMRVAFLKLDETATYVEGVGYAKTLPADAILAPDQNNPNAFEDYYVSEGLLVQRPHSPKPQPLETGGFRIPNCPPGTHIMIHDMDGDEVMADIVMVDEDPNVDFELPDQGEYFIEVEFPLPHLPSKATITVS